MNLTRGQFSLFYTSCLVYCLIMCMMSSANPSEPMTVVKKSIQPTRATPRHTRRQPKSPRGARVVKKVSEAARELLSSLPSHKVSVVAVSKAARLPRASLLLQFPDGVPEILEMLFTEEEAAFS